MAEVSQHLTVIHAALERASREAENDTLRQRAAKRAYAARLIMEGSAPDAVWDRLKGNITQERVGLIEWHAGRSDWHEVVHLGTQMISALPGDPIWTRHKPTEQSEIAEESSPANIETVGSLDGDVIWTRDKA